MWIFTQDGFVSIVDNRQEPGKLTVRARDRQSLELFSDVTGSPIIELPGRDYEYRCFISREDLSNWMLSQIDTLDYSNFKNRIYDTRGAVYHDACADVWSVMHQVSDKRS